MNASRAGQTPEPPEIDFSGLGRFREAPGGRFWRGAGFARAPETHVRGIPDFGKCPEIQTGRRPATRNPPETQTQPPIQIPNTIKP